MGARRRGLDPEEVDRLARRLDQINHDIASAANTLESAMKATEWRGHDHDEFVARFESELKPELRGVAAAYQSTAGDVRKQATEQRRASRS